MTERSYEEVFDDFWAPIVLHEDGTPNMDQIKRELADFHSMLEEIPKIFCEITHGRISKPNTLASAVIAVHNDCVDDIVNDFLMEHGQLLLDMLSPEDKHIERMVREIFPVKEE